MWAGLCLALTNRTWQIWGAGCSVAPLQLLLLLQLRSSLEEPRLSTRGPVRETQVSHQALAANHQTHQWGHLGPSGHLPAACLTADAKISRTVQLSLVVPVWVNKCSNARRFWGGYAAKTDPTLSCLFFSSSIWWLFLFEMFLTFHFSCNEKMFYIETHSYCTKITVPTITQVLLFACVNFLSLQYLGN